MQNQESNPALSESHLLQSKCVLGLRWNKQAWIKGFFSGSAAVAILVLVMIMASLLEQGSGFISSYRWELETYRKSGLEFVDIAKRPIAEQQELYGLLNRAYQAELNTISGAAKTRRDEATLALRHLESNTEKLRRQLEFSKEASPVDTARVQSLEKELKSTAESTLAIEPFHLSFSTEETKQLQSNLLSHILSGSEEVPQEIQKLNEAAVQKENEARSKFEGFYNTLTEFDELSYPLVDWEDPAKEIASKTKSESVQKHMAESEKAQLLNAAATASTPEDRDRFKNEADAVDISPIPYEERLAPLLAMREPYALVAKEYLSKIAPTFEQFPTTFETAEAAALYQKAKNLFSIHLNHVEQSITQLNTWDDKQKITNARALVLFLTGSDWITNSSWQDFYGVLPLLTGSVVIALIALIIALPFSIAAAIYTNQFASVREQNFIKPIIEFIQAIPSVVIGFIGISLVGDLIKDISQVEWLQWIPGFPIQERLNMFTAGVLLALMAIPTIFSLAEDALQNVPRAFSEASEALGATQLQGVFRVIVPSATSGILAAVLLGLGRIIGETMVVLLVAGNRIAIPNFSDGFGTIFQPAHTLTGIIAQELGEVSKGSVHWEALFMVGILLFAISLLINWASRFVARKFQLPKL